MAIFKPFKPWEEGAPNVIDEQEALMLLTRVLLEETLALVKVEAVWIGVLKDNADILCVYIYIYVVCVFVFKRQLYTVPCVVMTTRGVLNLNSLCHTATAPSFSAPVDLFFREEQKKRSSS